MTARRCVAPAFDCPRLFAIWVFSHFVTFHCRIQDYSFSLVYSCFGIFTEEEDEDAPAARRQRQRGPDMMADDEDEDATYVNLDEYV